MAVKARTHTGAAGKKRRFALAAALHRNAPEAAKTEAARILEAIDERRSVVEHVTDQVATLPATPGPATAAQIVLVDQAWRDIEQRYGALTSKEYAVFAGGTGGSRSMASRARDEKGLLGFRRGNRVLYPGFQFDKAGKGLLAGWLDMVTPLRVAGWDDEDIILWLAAPNGRLGRRSPVEVLNQGGVAAIAEVVADAAAGVQ